MAVTRMKMDSDAGIPDLIHRLGDDSRRLMTDEVQLAKLEIKDNMKRGGKGVMWLGIAFSVGVVALVWATFFLATLIGRLVNGHMWVGAFVTGVIELIVAIVLIKRGQVSFVQPSYSLERTRESLQETVNWAKTAV